MKDLKKTIIGLKIGKYMGISLMYNFRLDPNLSIRKVAVRRIPCVCNSCLLQLNSIWKSGNTGNLQKKFLPNSSCNMKNMFEDLNDWAIIKLI